MPWRFLDFLTSFLICFAVVFGPWAFGTTQTWSINVMNAVGCALGGLWLVRLIARQLTAGKTRSWAPATANATRLLLIATFLVLLYCWVSSLNARATYFPSRWEFQYHPTVAWLPHSYDSNSSWDMFWQSLSLAGFFWALRDWLLTMTPREAAEFSYASRANEPAKFPTPARLRLLLWVLAVSGTLLAIQGIIQRIGGGGKVLWLLELKPHGVAGLGSLTLFGPYPYRANAAQYFNLLWPVMVGLCWMEADLAHPHRRTFKSGRIFFLIAGVVFVAVCPLIANSRAGAAVAILNLGFSAAVLWLSSRKQNDYVRAKLIILAVAGIILVTGFVFGWAALAPRLNHLSTDAQSRQELSQVGWEIASDNPVFGTGPGSLETTFQLYRHNWNDFWPAQLHNDWMELLATFGCVGFGLILLCLGLAVSHCFFGGGIPAAKPLVWLLWIALAGCLLHARFDWPFECHSVLALFLVICAILSCLSWKNQPD